MDHNNEHMGKRYIEIQEAKRTEMEWVVTRMTGMGNVGMGEESDGFIRLRGLPYGASKKDIADFFSGMCWHYLFQGKKQQGSYQRYHPLKCYLFTTVFVVFLLILL